MADGTSAAATSLIFSIVEKLLARRGVAGPSDANQDLTDLGVTSLEMVNLMLAVEDEFGIEIPQRAMTPGNFKSIAAIERLVNSVALAA